MRAALLKSLNTPLVIEDIPKPSYGATELLVKVEACGLCRTDLHILDGDLKTPHFPLILGHEIVGIVEEVGKEVSRFRKGDRVGIPWLGSACSSCEYCKRARENLCDLALFTGYTKQGGFAEYTTCFAEFAIPLSPNLSSEKMAPFLCAGLIGYRSYRIADAEETLGFYGFGAAAHLLLQLACHEKKRVYVFTRPGDTKSQQEARTLGATWAGDSTMASPKPLDAAIIFAPIGDLIPLALKSLKKGGRCVCGGIHMTDIPSFAYKDLWGEKTIQSVANLTRQDANDYFPLIEKTKVQPFVTVYSLDQINQAIDDVRKGKIEGTAVITF